MAHGNGSAIRRRQKPRDAASTKIPEEQKKHAPYKPVQADLQQKSLLPFLVLFASHAVAAFYHPIQDCDEVFNYWEPTHYLNHGHGFQTWEYSPVYAIRSWTYAGIHALITIPGQLLPFWVSSKAAEFYFLRLVFAFICAGCEYRLFQKLTTVLNPRVAYTFVFIMATSPGTFHASIAYLPSSFTMYATMLGMAAFMDWRGGLRTAQGILATGAGAILGWPFAAVMAIPFLLEELMFAVISDKAGMVNLFWRVTDGTARVLLVLTTQVAIDAFFYRRLVIVPFNIVWYNVFSGKGGPDLYGTEPWHFYLRNLFLNFHVWLLLALLSMPLMLAQHFLRTKGATKANYVRGLVFLSPFYLWLAIFTLQPHKEERFLYPAYPALALNAAVALYILLANFGSTDPKDVISKIPVQLRFLVILAFILSSLAISALRVVGTITAYNAPLSIYKPLQKTGIANPGDTVCLGKEWYRFPSHYLLPQDVSAKFIKSEFSGLLPGEFYEGGSENGFGMFPGTWLEPPGMNDENREDTSKYTDLKHCNFLIDSFLPSVKATNLEPSFLTDIENWERVKCLPFLDATATGILGRLGWIPDLPFVPQKFRRVYGEYCLLKRRKTQGTPKIDPVPNIETLN